MGLLGHNALTGWDSYIKRVERKATMAMQQLAYSVSGRSPLHVATALQLFKTLVRPVLEYAVGIWGQLCTDQSKKLLERVQVQFGRRLLQLQRCIPGTYVRRELGLQSLEERGVAATLKYYGTLCAMDQSRLASKIFRYRCNNVEHTDHGLYSWCSAAKQALLDCGLRAAWRDRSVDSEEWPKTVKKAVRARFQEVEVQKTQDRPQLGLFHRLGPCMQKMWLERPLNHPGAALRFRLRCGGAPLMETVGAKKGDTVCRMCQQGQLENAEHFACRCSKYDDQRQECLRRITQLTAGVNAPLLRKAVAEQDVALFLGDSKLSELPPKLRAKVDMVVCNYLKVAWLSRQTVWRGLCVEGSDWRLKER